MYPSGMGFLSAWFFELIYNFEPVAAVHYQEQFGTIFWVTCHVLISGNNYYCCRKSFNYV